MEPVVRSMDMLEEDDEWRLKTPASLAGMSRRLIKCKALCKCF